MTTRERIVEALKIAEEAEPAGWVWAGQDVFSVGSSDMRLTEAQETRLRDLGFLKSYDQGWYCYT
jgi:hypothetical protein